MLTAISDCISFTRVVTCKSYEETSMKKTKKEIV